MSWGLTGGTSIEFIADMRRQNRSAAWDGTTHEPSPGWKPSTTPYIARGMRVDLPDGDHDLFHAINEHRATPEHMKKLIGQHPGVGIWWGTYDHPDHPDAHAYGSFNDFSDHAGDHEESVAKYHDSGEYHDRVNDAGGPGPNQIFAQTPVVMVGKRPKRGNDLWDPEIHNPSEDMMGNSYLDDNEPIDLHEVHYHSGRDWVKVPMHGHQVTAHTAELIKEKIPADRNWLDEGSPFKEYDEYPYDPVDYTQHDDSLSGNWYHVAPKSLNPGTKLVPGGGSGLHDTAPGEWEGDSGFANRRNHVWLAPNIEKAKFWQTQFGEGARIHQVKPGAKPQPWNMTGSEGFVVPHAHVLQDVTDDPNLRTASIEFPALGKQLPSVGEHPDNFWGGGGCAHMALAFKNMWPDLKIGADIDNKDGTVNHAWVHDGQRAHDFMGTHDSPDGPAGQWPNATTHMDMDPAHLASIFGRGGIKWSPGDPWEDHTVHEAAGEIEKHWLGGGGHDDDWEDDEPEDDAPMGTTTEFNPATGKYETRHHS